MGDINVQKMKVKNECVQIVGAFAKLSKRLLIIEHINRYGV